MQEQSDLMRVCPSKTRDKYGTISTFIKRDILQFVSGIGFSQAGPIYLSVTRAHDWKMVTLYDYPTIKM